MVHKIKQTYLKVYIFFLHSFSPVLFLSTRSIYPHHPHPLQPSLIPLLPPPPIPIPSFLFSHSPERRDVLRANPSKLDYSWLINRVGIIDIQTGILDSCAVSWILYILDSSAVSWILYILDSCAVSWILYILDSCAVSWILYILDSCEVPLILYIIDSYALPWILNILDSCAVRWIL